MNKQGFVIGEFTFWYQLKVFWRSRVHAHPGIELHFCEQGEGSFRVNGEEYAIEPGRATLIFGPTPHILRYNYDKPYQRTLLHIPENFFYKVTDFLGIGEMDFIPTPARPITQIVYSTKMYEIVRQEFHNMLGEFRRNSMALGPGMSLRLAEILYGLHRETHEPGNSHTPDYGVTSPYDRFLVEKAIKFAQKTEYTQLTAVDLANRLGISQGHLWRLFKRVMDVTPQQYLSNQRLDKGKELLLQGKSVKRVASILGYTAPSSFSRAFRARVGLSPSAFIHSRP